MASRESVLGLSASLGPVAFRESANLPDPTTLLGPVDLTGLAAFISSLPCPAVRRLTTRSPAPSTLPSPTSAFTCATSFSVKFRHFPLVNPASVNGPSLILTSFNTWLPTASTIRLTCRFRPSVIVNSKNVFVSFSRTSFTSAGFVIPSLSSIPSRSFSTASSPNFVAHFTRYVFRTWNSGFVIRSATWLSFVSSSSPLVSSSSRPTVPQNDGTPSSRSYTVLRPSGSLYVVMYPVGLYSST